VCVCVCLQHVIDFTELSLHPRDSVFELMIKDICNLCRIHYTF